MINIKKFLSFLGFTKHLSEKENIFTSATEPLNEPAEKQYDKIITQTSYPQEYNQYTKVLKNLLFTTQDSTLYNKLEENSISLELDIAFWLEAFITRSNTTKSEFDDFSFAFDDATIGLDNKNFTAKHIENFVNGYMSILLDDSIQVVDNHSFIWMIDVLAENGRLCVSKSEETAQIKSIEFVQEQLNKTVNKANMKEGDLGSLLDLLDEIENALAQLSISAQTDSIDEIIESNKIGVKKFSVLPSNPQELSNISRQWLQICKKFRIETSNLGDKDVQESTLMCLDEIEKVANSHYNFSSIEKLEISNAIQKDLPALLSNYASLPVSFRDNLIDKDSKKSVKQMVIDSIDNITSQITKIYMHNQTSLTDNSIQEIQKTAKYLSMKK